MIILNVGVLVENTSMTLQIRFIIKLLEYVLFGKKNSSRLMGFKRNKSI